MIINKLDIACIANWSTSRSLCGYGHMSCPCKLFAITIITVSIMALSCISQIREVTCKEVTYNR